MNDGIPYLSVIVTARNDDHGGSLLHRMQIFVNGWIEQCKRHALSSELIVVDWNPPQGRPPLMEALQWPSDFEPCEVRFIQVPPEVHGRYRHADALPLYQMIAKNVGIRRSRGRFILATNIDILFSNELMSFLAERRLQPGRMYRIDRHDAMSDVPTQATLDEQLEYCRTHLLRINAREGTFAVTRDGRRTLFKEDIAALNSGVSLGYGWYPPERHSDGEIFRWLEDEAELVLTLPTTPSATLTLELEPGPGVGHRPMSLQILDSSHSILDVEIGCRTLVQVHMLRLDSAARILRLRISGGGDPVSHDPRILNCRVFSCHLDDSSGEAIQFSAAPEPAATVAKTKSIAVRKQAFVLWERFQALIRRIAESGPLMTITVPVSLKSRRAAAFYVVHGGLTGMLRTGLGYVLRKPSARRSTARAGLERTTPRVAREPLTFLHTNACGDFTLAAREHWFDLRGYPEFDLYSMNIDSVFCYAAHHGGAREEVLADPMRIYHIEHGTGSGWTPEGQAALFERLAAKGVSFVPYDDVVGWAAQMRRLNCPMIFNRENWGLPEFDLPECRPSPGTPAGSAQPPVRWAAESA